MGALAEGFLGTGLEYDARIARSRGVSGESAAVVAQRRGRARRPAHGRAAQQGGAWGVLEAARSEGRMVASAGEMGESGCESECE
jgi:hypothetical protein